MIVLASSSLSCLYPMVLHTLRRIRLPLPLAECHQTLHCLEEEGDEGREEGDEGREEGGEGRGGREGRGGGRREMRGGRREMRGGRTLIQLYGLPERLLKATNNPIHAHARNHLHVYT